MGANELPDNANHGGGPRLVARLSREDRSVRRATWFRAIPMLARLMRKRLDTVRVYVIGECCTSSMMKLAFT